MAMETAAFQALGKTVRVTLTTPEVQGEEADDGAQLAWSVDVDAPSPAAAPPVHEARSQGAALFRRLEKTALHSRLTDEGQLLAVRLSKPGPASARRPSAATLATATVIVEKARTKDLAVARDLGAKEIAEGHGGQTLLRVDDVPRAFAVVERLLARGASASPNFIRRIARGRIGQPAPPWAHDFLGVAGAWRVVRGAPSVRVAVLDEGVDTQHAALREAVVGERDFIGGASSAMPDGDDAHGTACAGIILSRDEAVPGIAPGCSLLAARIAMSDGEDGWIFDDYATADAIDWAWKEGAAVISSSWSGGLPSDAVALALERARTRGRRGKGTVVTIAAGNDEGEIEFPGALPRYITVGASTPKDERKTSTSSDGEAWWGSNRGKALWLLAPGVFISTTDITGPRGYDPGDFTRAFNGTSAAAPHVAGAAALMLSANPSLGEAEVKKILRDTAVRLAGQTGRTDTHGWGRLSVERAVAVASEAKRSSGARVKAKRKPSAPRKAEEKPAQVAAKRKKPTPGGRG